MFEIIELFSVFLNRDLPAEVHLGILKDEMSDPVGERGVWVSSYFESFSDRYIEFSKEKDKRVFFATYASAQKVAEQIAGKFNVSPGDIKIDGIVYKIPLVTIKPD